MIWRRRRPATIELEDIQAHVVDALAFKYDHHLVLRLDDPVVGRAVVAAVLARGLVVDARARHAAKPPIAVNIGVSAAGMRRLGCREDLISSLGPAFAQGMAARADVLGDRGVSDPTGWEPGFADRDAHLLVWLHASHEDRLDTVSAELLALCRDGLTVVQDLRAAMRTDAREQFGFADGFSQPQIADLPARPGEEGEQRRRREQPLPIGEFVLGYRDAEGVIAAAGRRPFCRNASILVWRKLHQDVVGFRSWTHQTADDLGWDVERVAAKLVGRWRDGAPLVLAPDDHHRQGGADDPLALDDFVYADDRVGVRCPVGAHVRRVNPRDSLAFPGLPTRHRMIRRGMPYGEPLPPDAPDDGVDRGLLFAAITADPVRQFEFVQQQWCNDGSRLGAGDDRDPIIGAPHPSTRFVLPGSPPRIVTPVARFVTTRAGEYFLVPGLAALRQLADAADDPGRW